MSIFLLQAACLVLFSTFALAFAWLLAKATRSAGAAWQHMVWVAALAAVLAVPLARVFVPQREIDLVVPTAPAAIQTTQSAPSPPKIDVVLTSAPRLAAIPVTFAKPGRLSTPTGKMGLQSLPNAAASPALPAEMLPPILVALWLIGAAVVVCRVAFASIAIRRFARQSTRVRAAPMSLEDQARLAARVGVARPWELRIARAEEPQTALTWGARRPVVLLPAASATWTAVELESVLLHELAHIRRLDSLTRLVGALACAAYWFNPAVWLASRAMRFEAERAADDAVLSVGIKPSVYAQVLLQLAGALAAARRTPSTLGVPFMNHSKIESRVQSILSAHGKRRGVTSLHVLAAAAAGLGVVVPFSAMKLSLADAGQKNHVVKSHRHAKRTRARRSPSRRRRVSVYVRRRALSSTAALVRQEVREAKLAALKASMEMRAAMLENIRATTQKSIQMDLESAHRQMMREQLDLQRHAVEQAKEEADRAAAEAVRESQADISDHMRELQQAQQELSRANSDEAAAKGVAIGKQMAELERARAEMERQSTQAAAERESAIKQQMEELKNVQGEIERSGQAGAEARWQAQQALEQQMRALKNLDDQSGAARAESLKAMRQNMLMLRERMRSAPGMKGQARKERLRALEEARAQLDREIEELKRQGGD